ncbi:MAG: radical SAM protein, partial [Candidatus Aenigmatarchaeota archaeon]
MKIAFIHNPYYHQEFMENLDFVSNNFGVFPPLGIMYASSIIKREGHETKIFDVKAESLTKEDVIKKLKDFNPDIIGLMFIPFTASISLDWAKEIKDQLEVPIIAGNYAMIRYSEAILSNDFIDFGIIGSARETFPRFLEEWQNEKNFDGIEGLAFVRDGEVVINYPDKITEDFKKLPWPDREEIDNSLYYSMASKERPFTIIATSYGCTFNCDFCDMGKFGYSERDPKDVVDEIEYCIQEYGIKEIDIFDRDFLIDKGKAREICEEIIERGLDIGWSCRTRVDQVDNKILKLMKRAGCRLILYGIESGNQEILDKEHKGITLDETKKALELTRKNDIESLGFFI